MRRRGIVSETNGRSEGRGGCWTRVADDGVGPVRVCPSQALMSFSERKERQTDMTSKENGRQQGIERRGWAPQQLHRTMMMMMAEVEVEVAACLLLLLVCQWRCLCL